MFARRDKCNSRGQGSFAVLWFCNLEGAYTEVFWARAWQLVDSSPQEKEMKTEREPAEVISCKSCLSNRQMEFLGEICLHFQGGLQGLSKPPVWVFPQVLVCVDCGSAQFAVPGAELKVMQQSL